jgi:hypothetical protein
LQNKFPDIIIKADLTSCINSNSHYGFELTTIFPEISHIEVADRLTIWRFSGKPISLLKGDIYYRRVLNKFIRILQNLLIKIYGVDAEYIFPLDGGFKFHSKIFELQREKNYYIDGFWCNEDYFSNIREKIIAEFGFTEQSIDGNQLVLSMIQKTESVSVHIRRGDYVGNSSFDIVGIEYYKQAIHFISEKLVNPIFFFFTEDMDYVRNEFEFLENKYLVDYNKGKNSYKDMFLMSNCKHAIIANSTFSFWGAYLSKNNEKIVIAPNRFVKNIDYCLACNSWTII